jgi:hypothetical protein
MRPARVGLARGGGLGNYIGRRRRHRLVGASMTSAGKSRRKVPEAAVKSAGAADGRIATLLKALRANLKLAPVVDAHEKQSAVRGRKFGKNGSVGALSCKLAATKRLRPPAGAPSGCPP